MVRQKALRMLAACERIEAGVGGNPVEPCAKRAASVEAAEAAPGAQIGLLHGILGFVQGAKHAVAMHFELAAEGFGHLFKRPV